MSEQISNDPGFHRRNVNQYNLEERMNEGLKKQFAGMFEDDSMVQDSSRLDNVLNSCSEFNFSEHPAQRDSRNQLISNQTEPMNENMHSIKQRANRTSQNFANRNTIGTRGSQRPESGSATR